MAYWIDTALGSGDNDGTSPANALRGTSAIKTGLEVGHNAGVRVWIRRTSAYDEGVVELDADIAPTANGTAALPVYFAGWPRAAIPNTTITEGDWTNGSTTVDNIVGITCARLAHQARWATAPDGHKYLITRVVDANTIIIDREYAGGTVTGIDGKFQIEEDEDYDIRNDEEDGSGWDADAHDLPEIDFNDEAYQIFANGDEYLSFRNLSLKNTNDAYGLLEGAAGGKIEILGCLFKQNSINQCVFHPGYPKCVLRRFTIEGSGAGGTQNGIGYSYGANGVVDIADGAIYNCGNHGLQADYQWSGNLKNVNIGVEIANGDDEISIGRGALFEGYDVKLGGSNGYILINSTNPGHKVSFENYQKILGSHKSWNFGGEAISIAVTSTNANKKLSDTVLQISPNQNRVFVIDDWKQDYFVGNFDLDAGAHTIKYWIYNDTGDTLNDTAYNDNIFLEGKYIDSYDDTSEYTIASCFSTEIDILDAADADDWDFLTLSFTLAIAGRVKVYLRVAKYEATAYILLDPESVIT